MVDVIKLGVKRPVSKPLLPDPEPRKTHYTLISVDDHLMEAPDTFEGRLPAKLQARGPKVIETEEGHEIWQLDGQPYFQVGFMCVAGRPKEDHRVEPARFDLKPSSKCVSGPGEPIIFRFQKSQKFGPPSKKIWK